MKAGLLLLALQVACLSGARSWVAGVPWISSWRREGRYPDCRGGTRLRAAVGARGGCRRPHRAGQMLQNAMQCAGGGRGPTPAVAVVPPPSRPRHALADRHLHL